MTTRVLIINLGPDPISMKTLGISMGTMTIGSQDTYAVEHVTSVSAETLHVGSVRDVHVYPGQRVQLDEAKHG